jgi:hypothetical protein
MLLSLPKKTFFEQTRGLKRRLQNFGGVAIGIFINCSKNALKKHLKCCSKDLLLKAPQMCITFSRLFADFASYRGRPLEFSVFFLLEIQANTRTNNNPKSELQYLQIWIY